MKKIGRNAVAAATPTVIADLAPLVRPASAAQQDAELLALREPFERTFTAFKAALAAFGEAEQKMWARKKARKTSGAGDEQDEEFAAAKELLDQASDANTAIVDEICTIQARTAEGLAFKARVSSQNEDNRHEELIASIMEDVIAFAERSSFARRAPPNVKPLAYRPKEAAVLLGVSRSQLYRMMAAGEIQHGKLGGTTLIRHEEVYRVLDAVLPSDEPDHAAIK